MSSLGAIEEIKPYLPFVYSCDESSEDRIVERLISQKIVINKHIKQADKLFGDFQSLEIRSIDGFLSRLSFIIDYKYS